MPSAAGGAGCAARELEIDGAPRFLQLGGIQAEAAAQLSGNVVEHDVYNPIMPVKDSVFLYLSDNQQTKNE